MKGNEFLVKTIVTSEVIAQIAKKNNVEPVRRVHWLQVDCLPYPCQRG